jgi:zinc protease
MRSYRPDMTTIVVIGNVTPAAARTTIEKYFGDWKATGRNRRSTCRRFHPTNRRRGRAGSRPRARPTSLVETVPLTRRDSDYYALELGDHVLGGGFYATRLYHDLRQVAGLVYTVSNQLEAGRTRSTYTVSYGCDPPNVSKARRLIVRDLRAMQTTDVTPAELEQAKAICCASCRSPKPAKTVASALAARSLAGLPFDEGHRSAEIYAKLDAAQFAPPSPSTCGQRLRAGRRGPNPS